MPVPSGRRLRFVTAALPALHSPLELCLGLLAGWVIIGLIGVVRPTRVGLTCGVLYPAGAVIGAALALIAAASLAMPPEQRVLPLGLPDLPLHLRRDALSSVFLLLLGRGVGRHLDVRGRVFPARPGHAAGTDLPAIPPVPRQHGLRAAGRRRLRASWWPGRRWRCPRISWSPRSIGSPRSASAGFLYLLIAHVGAIAILLSFGVLQGGSWQFTFDAMRAAHLSPRLGGRCVPARAVRVRRQGRPGAAARMAARSASGRAVAGLGADERRDAEDGAVRDAAGDASTCSASRNGGGAWCRSSLGLFSALYGAVFAAVQTDMKRLLAYSSIENIGIMFTGLGLALVFQGVGMPAVARAGADRSAVPRAQPRVHEEPAVSRHRRGAACDRRAQPRRIWAA